MRFKRLAIAAIVAVGALTPTAARAVQWFGLGETDESRLYLDLHSVKRRGNVVQYWQQGVLKQPGEGGITSIKRLERLDCKTANYDILREVTYIGGRVHSDVKVTWKETRSIVPGSIGEDILKKLCKR